MVVHRLRRADQAPVLRHRQRGAGRPAPLPRLLQRRAGAGRRERHFRGLLAGAGLQQLPAVGLRRRRRRLAHRLRRNGGGGGQERRPVPPRRADPDPHRLAPDAAPLRQRPADPGRRPAPGHRGAQPAADQRAVQRHHRGELLRQLLDAGHPPGLGYPLHRRRRQQLPHRLRRHRLPDDPLHARHLDQHPGRRLGAGRQRPEALRRGASADVHHRRRGGAELAGGGQRRGVLLHLADRRLRLRRRHRQEPVAGRAGRAHRRSAGRLRLLHGAGGGRRPRGRRSAGVRPPGRPAAHLPAAVLGRASPAGRRGPTRRHRGGDAAASGGGRQAAAGDTAAGRTSPPRSGPAAILRAAKPAAARTAAEWRRCSPWRCWWGSTTCR